MMKSTASHSQLVVTLSTDTFKKYISHNYVSRTKDNTFVYCALKKVITKALEKAAAMGVVIDQIVHKV